MFSTSKTLSLLALASAATASPIKRSTFDWSKISYLFQLGDSYTSVGYTGKAVGEIFNYIQPQSSTGDGPMWGTALSVNSSSNPSGTQQIDYAVSGATVNNTIVPHQVNDMVTQASLFKADFSPAPSNFSWTAENSLHTFFIGINDVANSQGAENQTALHEEILKSYENALETIYSTGSRNWLFLNVPPFEKAHFGIDQGVANQTALGKSIVDYNAVLDSRLKAFCQTKADVNCLYFDTYSLFNDIIENPGQYGFSSGTEYCPAYASLGGVTPSYVQTEPCEPLPSYFWLNTLHPTWVGHKILAAKVGELLKQS